MKHFWLFLVVLGVAAARAAGPHPSLPPPVVPECLGVNLRAGELKKGELDALAGAGFRWVRMDLMWAATERERGRYDFSAYDRLVAELMRRKLRVVFVLGYGNPLYADAGDTHPFASRSNTPEFREAFAAWAVAAVTHYRGRGHLWELWNEPNREGFVGPEPYVALASATGEALRAAGLLGPRGEALIGPATAAVDVPFLEACCRGGLLAYWDGVSVHPARESAPETVEEELRSVRLLIAKYAPAGKTVPVISSAWGYASDSKVLTENEWGGRETQAKYLAREFLTNIANDVALSIWSDWRDDAGRPEGQRGYGLVEYTKEDKASFDKKPAYVAMQTMKEQFGGFRFSKRLHSWNSDEDYTLLFHKQTEVRAVVWTTRARPEVIGIPASPDLSGHSFVAVDGGPVFSAKDERRTGFGLKFVPNASPLYVRFPPSDVLLQMAVSATRLPLEYRYSMPGFAPSMVFGFRNYAPHSIKARLTSSDERVNEKWVLLAGNKDTREVNSGGYFGIPIAAKSNAQATEKTALMLGIEVVPLGDTNDDGLISIAQKVRLVATNPMSATRMPGKPDEIVVKFENASGADWKGPVFVVGHPIVEERGRGGMGGWGGWGPPTPPDPLAGKRREPANTTTTPVLTEPIEFEISRETKDAVARIPIRTLPTDSWWRGVRAVSIVAANGLQGEFPITDDRFFELDLNGVQVIPDGDPKVKVRSSHEPAEPPGGPLMEGVSSLRVRYDFDEGWKSVRVINPTWPPANEKNLIGKPEEFGVWVYGDGQGCVAHMRFIDATNQVFQTVGVPVNWIGWRHVQFPMKYRPGKKLESWGGAEDGDIHYPIDLEAVLVLDNVSRRVVKGEIYVCGPSLIY